MMPSIQQLFATSKMLALAALNTDESEGPLPPKTVLIPSYLRVDLLLLQKDFRFSLDTPSQPRIALMYYQADAVCQSASYNKYKDENEDEEYSADNIHYSGANIYDTSIGNDSCDISSHHICTAGVLSAQNQ